MLPPEEAGAAGEENVGGPTWTEPGEEEDEMEREAYWAAFGDG